MIKRDRKNLRRRLLLRASSAQAHLSSLMLVGTASCVLVLASSHAARAYSLYNGELKGTALEINLDTTLEYSNIFRVNDPSAIYLNNVNGNEGDDNFRHGLVSNEFEVTPIFDLKYGNFGIHLSGEAFLNTVYLQKNQNNSPASFNPISTASNRDFTSATTNDNGRNARLLDAFVSDSQYFGANDQQQLSLKFGRQTLLWGQSLLFPGDGISAGQAPIDVQFAQSTPNALAQQVFLPVGQAVVTYQPNDFLTLQGYYQFEWEPDNLQGVGSYFSSADILDKGGQRLLLGQEYGFPPQDVAAYRVKDDRPRINNGQFGLSAQVTLGNYDFGLYALRYDSKQPNGVYLGPPQSGTSSSPTNAASYWLVYPRDIQLYGGSFSTTLGAVNIAGELSGRVNAPLDSDPQQTMTYPGSANAGALYAAGKVINFQVSQIYVSPPLPFDPGGLSVDAEEIINSVISIDRNRAALTPGRQATAGAFQFIVTPTYFFDAIPNVQFNIPVGMEMGLFNRSQFDGTENHGIGDVNIGVTAIYKQTWTAGLVYQDYLGEPNVNYQNDLADRGYVSFNIEHTF